MGVTIQSELRYIMCGIIGAVGSALPSQKKFIKARDSLRHRGPDDSGVYYSETSGAALGHRRLSILDLTSAGQQPLSSADGRYVVVFNGEIYNYRELKKELRGYHFITHTDTEVLLAAYGRWGRSCLDKFNGMFAFAVWDTKKRALFCARDRLGVKPFYYTMRNGTFYFASEIKGLLTLGIPARANERVIFDYLYHGLYDHTPETFFDGVYRLPAESYVSVSAGEMNFGEYWNLAEAVRDVSPPRNMQDACEEFRSLLADSVRLRFRSDVPVGLTLSSGLDSSGLLHYARAVTGAEPHKFSMCSLDKAYDECPLIAATLSRTEKTTSHTTTLKPDDVMAGARRMNEIQDEPYGGIPAIAYGDMMRQAQAAGVTVLLEGEGLDELLAGYQYYMVEREK